MRRPLAAVTFLLSFLTAIAQAQDLLQDEEQRAVARVAFSPDGRQIATCDFFDAPGGLLSAAVAPDGKKVYLGGRGNVYLWNAASGAAIQQLKHGLNTVSVAIAPDGKSFASGNQDCGVKLWDAATGEPEAGFSNAEADVRAIVFAPDGKKLLIGTGDGHLKAQDPATGAVLKSVSAHECPVAALAISPDGRKTATGGSDFKIKVWNTP